MLKKIRLYNPSPAKTVARGALPLFLIFLFIEFFDELAYGFQGAALPLLRSELGLSYAQIGLLMGVPTFVGVLIEPLIMLLGDTRLRKLLILGGGLVITFAMLLLSLGTSFSAALLALAISYPASGAFVSLSQASLMGLDPGRETHLMARWTLSGNLGSLAGPLLLSALLILGLGWRSGFGLIALLAVALVILVLPQRLPQQGQLDKPVSPRQLLAGLLDAAKDRKILRWLLLLEFSDLMLDIYASYAALYFTDVVGFSPVLTGIFLSLFMLASLASDLVLIPLLHKVNGRTIVRSSAGVVALLYAGMLLIPHPTIKAILALGVRFSTLGWYSVLQGEAFAAAPQKTGTLMAVGSVFSLVNGALAWLLGWLAYQYGLPQAMWLLVLGPIFLLLFTPRPTAPLPAASREG